MTNVKDHKTGYLWDQWEHLGPKRRILLQESWAGLFQEHVLPHLPVERVFPFFSETMGRPTKERQEKTKLEPDESTADIVRDIFDLYLMGAGYRSISAEIREKYGRKLTKTTLESILRNKTYKGWIVFQPKTGGIDADQPGVETPGAHQAIIDEITFDQVQVEMSRRGEAQSGRTHSSNSIFTGILHCAHCGAKLTWESALGCGKKRYTYYYLLRKKERGILPGVAAAGRQVGSIPDGSHR
jgi:hypothetical protein